MLPIIHDNYGLAEQYRLSGYGLAGDFAGSMKIVYLLRDEFTTDEAAPLASPRTCEPGPGSFTFIDTNNLFSIAGGELVGEEALAAGVGDPSIVSVDGYDFTVGGTAVIWSHYMPQGAGNERIKYGIGNGSVITLGIRQTETKGINIVKGGYSNTFAIAVSGTELNKIAAVCRTGGGEFIFLQLPAGTWKLIWVGFGAAYSATSKAVVLAESASYSVYTKLTYIRIANLAAGLDTRYGIATDHQSSAGIGTEIAQSADAFVQAEIAANPSAASVNMAFRRTDDDNCWYARLTEGATDTIKLIERNGGVETERASTNVAFAGNPGIAALCKGNSIWAIYHRGNGQIYQAPVANGYTSAFNNTATSAKLVDLTADDFSSYSVDPPAAVIAELDRYTA